jgi:hypothetical protein
MRKVLSQSKPLSFATLIVDHIATMLPNDSNNAAKGKAVTSSLFINILFANSKVVLLTNDLSKEISTPKDFITVR